MSGRSAIVPILSVIMIAVGADHAPLCDYMLRVRKAAGEVQYDVINEDCKKIPDTLKDMNMI